MKKFYNFKNITEDSADLYIYGALTNNKEDDWYPSSDDVDLTDFKNKLDEIKEKTILNIYVNSPGGSVFASSTMASMLQRAKDVKKIKITSYIDGLCASAASFLIMVSDEIKLYDNSMLMIHKPMSFTWGNANDMLKEIETLNSIEDNVMIPLYMKKAKVSIEKIKELIDKESWLSANEVDNLFNVTLIGSPKECKAYIDSELFKRYKNIPEELEKELEKGEDMEEHETLKEEIKTELKEELKQEILKELQEEKPLEEEKSEEVEEIEQEIQNIDYSYYDYRLKRI